MGMPSAQVQPGTQPQGKGFAQPINPPNNPSQMMGMSSKIGRLPPMISDELAAPAVEPEMSQVMPPAQQQSQGKGGSPMYSRTSGQPAFGQPNRYPNTVGQWDNASIQRQSPTGGGKGKG
jgi:hypothetical protein